MWGPRGVVWTVWSSNAAISAVYCIVALMSYMNVKQLYDRLGSLSSETHNQSWVALVGILSSCLLSLIIAGLYILFSFVILIRSSISKKATATFGHGVLMTASVYTAVFMLLCALTLHCHEQQMMLGLSNRDVNAYQATFYFAYVLTGTYTVMFIILLIYKSAFIDAKAIQ